MSVKVKNKATGVESSFTQAEWEKVQNNPRWDGVFQVIETPKPKEVIELEAKKQQPKKESEK